MVRLVIVRNVEAILDVPRDYVSPGPLFMVAARRVTQPATKKPPPSWAVRVWGNKTTGCGTPGAMTVGSIAHRGAPEAQGLTAAIAVAAPSPVQSIAQFRLHALELRIARCPWRCGPSVPRL